MKMPKHPVTHVLTYFFTFLFLLICLSVSQIVFDIMVTSIVAGLLTEHAVREAMKKERSKLVCPNIEFCDQRRRRGSLDLNFCFCAIRRAYPGYIAPTEANPKTVGMVLPRNEDELETWSRI